MEHTQDSSLTNLVSALEARARAAGNLAELGFSIANDSYDLLAFRQALVFDGDKAASRLQTVSGLAHVTEDSPYLIWLCRVWPWLQEQFGHQPGWYQPVADDAAMPPEIMAGWREWWPAGVFALPLRKRTGETLGWACFLLDNPPTEQQAKNILHVSLTWSYCWEMLQKTNNKPWFDRLRTLSSGRRWLAVLAVAALMLLPIHQTAMAPAEVIALDATTVASPLDGVVKTIHVRPNQPVKAGEKLFSLDDTTLRNRLEVAQQSVAVADAELLATTNKSFDNLQSKSDLAMLSGRTFEKRAELAAVQAQLNRIDVVAGHDGVAIFGDPDDWLGRPVSTGERIMLLADPKKPGILIHLPVADAVSLDIGDPVKLFLTVLPLSPLDATITETSFQAVLSPTGVAGYRLRAAFTNTNEQARIGLRGTAKIYGDRVALGYYLLRRPLARVREWSGW
ncbi:HlyD family efflux transporter periplasmic adaptor subunit [Desulfopila sp. IMCC35006]|uniref:efflux RND transporter periplasmic adaptor subunit n=1 Tax=Desulfopila sp. IMCC35006 TaxID=2569542 RepID=UPI0010AC16BA|nr:biotin/lipoyl-binding protein [Desulfopila sp. IMCC35006]TKB26268.1 HlyD family efflux transporter periplasmic adaptor subunit [Desulfopila sp. IMCC35006]